MIHDSEDESTGEDSTGPRMLHISYNWHGPGQGRSYKVIYTTQRGAGSSRGTTSTQILESTMCQRRKEV